jgi:polysaccharide biosynthesis protein VpsQ
MNIKKITMGYIIFILMIIVLADQGDYIAILKDWVDMIPYGDKGGHLILMGLLSLTVNLSFKCTLWTVGQHTFLKGSVIVAILVTLEEISQLFFSYRTFDWGDLLFDYLGILGFGQLAWYLNQVNHSVTDENMN